MTLLFKECTHFTCEFLTLLATKTNRKSLPCKLCRTSFVFGLGIGGEDSNTGFLRQQLSSLYVAHVIC